MSEPLRNTEINETSGAETLEKKKNKDAAYYIKSVIGLAIMAFFGYLPAPEPITEVGMTVLGQFIGLIFLWTLVDLVWPTFAAIVMFGTVAFQVYPGSFALAGVYEAGMQSIGCWVVVIMIGLLIVCEVFNETGLMRRIAMWFLNTKTAKRSSWGFTFMFLLAAFIIGILMDVTVAQVFMLALAKEIFDAIGMNKDDKWTKIITIGITFSVVIGFGATPFCHTLPILFMGIYAGIAGAAINWVSYMLITVPVGIVIWFAMLGFMRYIVKPDMSKLTNMDHAKMEEMRPGPMSKREKTVAVLAVLLIISWILPGFLSILLPNAGFTTWMNGITMLTPLLVVIVIMAIVRVEGRPLLDISAVMNKVSFTVVFFLAGIMLIATAMGEDTTGISNWVREVLAPMTEGMSPFVFIAFLALASVILTNIANNVPVGIIMITVGVPLALQMGMNPFLVAVTVSFASNLAFTIPPAFVPVGICYADPFGGPKTTLKWGLVMCLICVVLCALLIYPLGLLFA